MDDDLSQPPSTGGPHLGGASEQRGRTLTRDAVVVGAIVAVGTSWYLLAGADTAGFLHYVVLILTPALAVTFGASMTKARGFAMSVLVAAAIVVGVFLAAGDLSENPEDGAFFIVLFAVVVTILMLAFWFIGFVIGSLWRRVARR